MKPYECFQLLQGIRDQGNNQSSYSTNNNVRTHNYEIQRVTEQQQQQHHTEVPYHDQQLHTNQIKSYSKRKMNSSPQKIPRKNDQFSATSHISNTNNYQTSTNNIANNSRSVMVAETETIRNNDGHISTIINISNTQQQRYQQQLQQLKVHQQQRDIEQTKQEMAKREQELQQKRENQRRLAKREIQQRYNLQQQLVQRQNVNHQTTTINYNTDKYELCSQAPKYSNSILEDTAMAIIQRQQRIEQQQLAEQKKQRLEQHQKTVNQNMYDQQQEFRKQLATLTAVPIKSINEYTQLLRDSQEYQSPPTLMTAMQTARQLFQFND
jgi:hypothetical protein